MATCKHVIVLTSIDDSSFINGKYYSFMGPTQRPWPNRYSLARSIVTAPVVGQHGQIEIERADRRLAVYDFLPEIK